MRFVLFTKTPWAEPPRLRHQVAQMLARRGHDVTFFEKNRPLGRRRGWDSDGIHVRGHGELLHHQLRVTRGLSSLNWIFERNEIRRQVPCDPDTVVINFNYDYCHLRDIFPRQPILSIFNDDFVEGSRWFSRKEVRRVQAETARISDHALAVSYPLLDRLREATPRASLFLPWARRGYRRPPDSGKRDAMLCWGYVNERLDVPAMTGVLNRGVRIHFVGPVQRTPVIEKLLRHPNSILHPEAQLDELGPVLAECACSILPYDPGAPMVSAITVNNRAFEILSAGLVLLYADLPALINAPPNVIYRCRSVDDYMEAFRAARVGFEGVQPDIEAFLKDHTEEKRYEQLMNLVREAGASGDVGSG